MMGVSDECHVGEGGALQHAIKTITSNGLQYSTREKLKAREVRRYQHIAGHPSDATIIYSAATNNILNCPIKQRDVKLTNTILGPSKYALEGKRTRRQPDAVDAQIVEVPPQMLDYYKDVSLSIDVMHVNQVPILISISKNIHYGTCHALLSMKIPTMEAEILDIIKTYSARGFRIVCIQADIQFKALKDRNNLLEIKVTICGRGEHILSLIHI